MKRNKYIKDKLFIFAAMLVATLGFQVARPATPAYAAEPGCYVSYAAPGTTSATDRVYEASNCPTGNSTISNGVSDGKCYVAPLSSQGPGTFQYRDCDTFEVGRTPIQENTQANCEGTGGEWVTVRESVGGVTIDESFCRCDSGFRLIDGRCVAYDVEEPGEEDSGNDPDDSNSERPGSVSNRCTLLTQTEKENLSQSDPCYALKTTDNVGDFQCGRGDKAIKTSINIGCRGEDYPGTEPVNPIIDLMFALFRVLSAGVGLVIIGSIIVAGIQYSASRGNPQTTQASMTRVTNAFIALLLYIFMYALANFLVPGGILL